MQMTPNSFEIWLAEAHSQSGLGFVYGASSLPLSGVIACLVLSSERERVLLILTAGLTSVYCQTATVSHFLCVVARRGSSRFWYFIQDLRLDPL